MNISFQLVELPENEQVLSRQITLPSSGGTIGRSYECTIQLPDHSCTLSRVHVEISPLKDGGFQLIDRSVNGCQVNGVDLGVGQSIKLNDGDNVRIGGYLMLVSNMDELFSDVAHSEKRRVGNSDKDVVKNAEFSFDSVIEEPTEAFFANDIESITPEKTRIDAVTFSSENVFSEDAYAYDPFEEDDELSMLAAENESSGNVVMVTEHQVSAESSDPGITLSNDLQLQALDTSIERLNQLVKHQQTSLTAAIDRERLFSCIEVTLDKFLADFNPEALEDEFNDYISGWGNKDKKYWSLYKKQFMRKQQKSEFKRQFTALLMEELREK
ncbi:uncharacterized protein ImpI/VasC [Vibrio ponticus]|nr:uncharacterized protein ImpI/VasC [Vibrio ponticus]